MLDRLKAPKGSRKKPKRVGRGEASGWGRCAGRGEKGQRSRSGSGKTPGFEGGQMPLQRRVPKRGFHNKLRVPNRILNVGVLNDAFSDGDSVDEAALLAKRLIKGKSGAIKVLGKGEIKKALNVKAGKFSATAAEKIKAAGGRAEVA